MKTGAGQAMEEGVAGTALIKAPSTRTWVFVQTQLFLRHLSFHANRFFQSLKLFCLRVNGKQGFVLFFCLVSFV